MKKISEEKIDDIIREITTVPYHHFWYYQDQINLYSDKGEVIETVVYKILPDETLEWELITYEPDNDFFKKGICVGTGKLDLSKFIEK